MTVKRYAKIVGGKVVQVQPYDDVDVDGSPTGVFIQVPVDTIPGQIDNGDGTFGNPPPSPAPTAPIERDIDKITDLLIDAATGTAQEKAAAIATLKTVKTKRTAIAAAPKAI